MTRPSAVAGAPSRSGGAPGENQLEVSNKGSMRQLVTFAGVLAVFVFTACSPGTDAALTPEATSTPVIATVAPVRATSVPAEAPQPGPDSDLSAFLAEIDARVAEIRGIPEPPPVPYKFVTESGMADFLATQLEDPEFLDDIKMAEVLYKLLGLIEQDSDLLEEYSSLLNSQVLGAYDPEEQEFVVLQRGAEFGALQELTYAHEYVHRLQDALVGLEALTDSVDRNDDQALAVTALVEGDATAAQTLYMLQNMDFGDLARVLEESGLAIEAVADVPFILRRALEFPYVEGVAFVNTLVAAGGFEAVDDAYAALPDSTEQVLHAEKYFSREQPVRVELPGGLFPDDWDVVYENTMGEFFLKAWLESLGVVGRTAASAAAGWGGDSFLLATGPAGDSSFVALIVWDEPSTDPAEFFGAISGGLESGGEFARLNAGADAGVRVFDGPGGVLAVANLAGTRYGTVTVVTVAANLREAVGLLLRAAS